MELLIAQSTTIFFQFFLEKRAVNLANPMASSSCPIPEVEEALAPYIHSRQETKRIREAIARHVCAPIESNISPSLRLACPNPNSEVRGIPGGIDGLYLRYYDAMRANLAARQQYAEVKQELDEARQCSVISGTHGITEGGKTNSVQNYIELQRRRRQHNKLKIVQETMEKLKEQAPRSLDGDLGELLKSELGQAPDPPKSSLGGGAADADVDSLVFRLKRELLLAKNGMDQTNRMNTELHEHSKGLPEPSAEAQVYALRAARNELIGWIEGELAKIPEGDTSIMEDDNHDDDGSHASNPLSAAEVSNQIQALYDKYIAARKNLVEKVEVALAVSKQNPTPAAQVSAVRSGGSQPESLESLRYSDLMNYVPTLVQAARTERSLIQQASYLRRQLVTASEDTGLVIQRLAGESYMVPPDTMTMEAWVKAAASKSEETDTFVREQVIAGRRYIEATDENLGRVDSRRVVVDQLRGDV